LRHGQTPDDRHVIARTGKHDLARQWRAHRPRENARLYGRYGVHAGVTRGSVDGTGAVRARVVRVAERNDNEKDEDDGHHPDDPDDKPTPRRHLCRWPSADAVRRPRPVLGGHLVLSGVQPGEV
jgi:hypothetical protein